MPYVTKDQLVARFGHERLVQLTDRVSPYTGTVVASVIDQAIASADAVIDLHISKRAQLPLVVVPTVLVDIAGALAFANLHVDAMPDKVAADHTQAMKLLRDIAQGVLSLDVGGTTPAAPQPVGIEVDAAERVFGRNNMAGW